MTNILLHRIDAAKNERRYYFLATGPTLLDPYAVTRIWGRIGGQQHCMITACCSADEEQALIERLGRQKIKRGYQLVQRKENSDE